MTAIDLGAMVISAGQPGRVRQTLAALGSPKSR